MYPIKTIKELNENLRDMEFLVAKMRSLIQEANNQIDMEEYRKLSGAEMAEVMVMVKGNISPEIYERLAGIKSICEILKENKEEKYPVN